MTDNNSMTLSLLDARVQASEHALTEFEIGSGQLESDARTVPADLIAAGLPEEGTGP